MFYTFGQMYKWDFSEGSYGKRPYPFNRNVGPLQDLKCIKFDTWVCLTIQGNVVLANTYEFRNLTNLDNDGRTTHICPVPSSDSNMSVASVHQNKIVFFKAPSIFSSIPIIKTEYKSTL